MHNNVVGLKAHL